MVFSYLATAKYRWVALVFLALGLAIVIIDNTVLNVAIPYILRDLQTSFDGIQWVISGYALIIATLMIPAGKLGDLWGRKRVFLLGTVLFAIGSFIASIAPNIVILFLGEAFIEAIGAAMMMTSSLALLVSEFQGRERAIAFGVWGSVAGASAAVGPLLGGFLTTYYSWRWSLRINVGVALIAILGSVFIQECFGEKGQKFDFIGVLLSGIGLFSLIFSFIEGQRFGWWHPATSTILSWHWPLSVSLIFFTFDIAAIFLLLFIAWELFLENNGKTPLLRISLFIHPTFTIGLITLFILALGQFGTFFIMPIYLQNVLGLTAFQTGLVFLSSSIAILIMGPLTGFLAARIGPKWLVTLGMISLGIGTWWLHQTIAVGISPWSLTPALVFFGIGIGMGSAQLTNVILSDIPVAHSGEASAVNSTIRQVATSIGIAIIGVIFANALSTHIPENITADIHIPSSIKKLVVQTTKNFTPESGQVSSPGSQQLVTAVKDDINKAMVTASKDALFYALIFTGAGTLMSFFIPQVIHASVSNQKTSNKPSNEKKEEQKQEEMPKEQTIFVSPQEDDS